MPYIWRARARSGRGVRKVRGESPGPRSLARPWRREPSRRALMMIEPLSPASQIPCLEAVCPWLAFPSRATGGRREPRDRDAGGRSGPSRLLVGSLLRGVRGVRSSVGVRVRAGRSVFVGLWVLDLRMGRRILANRHPGASAMQLELRGGDVLSVVHEHECALRTPLVAAVEGVVDRLLNSLC